MVLLGSAGLVGAGGLDEIFASIQRLDAPQELRERLLGRAVEVAASAVMRQAPEKLRDKFEDGYKDKINEA
eukprot:7904417-Alexandrium_andersonii.AAC.1